MVRLSLTAGVCVTLFISLFLPVLTAIIYAAKNKGKNIWMAWFLGAAGFFLFQVVLRMPVLNIISLSGGFSSFIENYYVLYCFILAFSAALFEVIGRFAVAKILNNKNLTFKKGFAAGLGHGGIESMLIIGMTYITNIIYIIMINTGRFDSIIEQTAALGADTSGLTAARDALLTSSPVLFYLAGYERILTMILQTALSLIVCYFVWKKKDITGIIICLVIHTLADFITPLISGYASSYMGNKLSTSAACVIIYVFLTVLAAVSVFIILKIKKKWTE